MNEENEQHADKKQTNFANLKSSSYGGHGSSTQASLAAAAPKQVHLHTFFNLLLPLQHYDHDQYRRQIPIGKHITAAQFPCTLFDSQTLNSQKNASLLKTLGERECVIVYQAYNHQIGDYIVKHGQIFGCLHYQMTRTSWIKPNFLWMMYRCGWASKKNQERVFAFYLSKENFLNILKEAVHAHANDEALAYFKNMPGGYKSQLGNAQVVLQWDPHHSLVTGSKINLKRAIQLGMSGATLEKFTKRVEQGGYLEHVEDVTAFVKEQYCHVLQALKLKKGPQQDQSQQQQQQKKTNKKKKQQEDGDEQAASNEQEQESKQEQLAPAQVKEIEEADILKNIQLPYESYFAVENEDLVKRLQLDLLPSR